MKIRSDLKNKSARFSGNSNLVLRVYDLVQNPDRAKSGQALAGVLARVPAEKGMAGVLAKVLFLHFPVKVPLPHVCQLSGSLNHDWRYYHWDL